MKSLEVVAYYKFVWRLVCTLRNFKVIVKLPLTALSILTISSFFCPHGINDYNKSSNCRQWCDFNYMALPFEGDDLNANFETRIGILCLWIWTAILDRFDRWKVSDFSELLEIRFRRDSCRKLLAAIKRDCFHNVIKYDKYFTWNKIAEFDSNSHGGLTVESWMLFELLIFVFSKHFEVQLCFSFLIRSIPASLTCFMSIVDSDRWECTEKLLEALLLLLPHVVIQNRA